MTRVIWGSAGFAEGRCPEPGELGRSAARRVPGCARWPDVPGPGEAGPVPGSHAGEGLAGAGGSHCSSLVRR